MGEDMQNMKNNNSCIGVSYIKRKKAWQARTTTTDGACGFLGQYKGYFDACCARKSWEAKELMKQLEG